MAAHILNETVRTFREIAARIPASRTGARRTSPATVWRWALKGVRSPSGELIRLEAVRCGSKWLTSDQAFVRFTNALTAASVPDSAPVQTPAERHKAAEQAGVELERLGVG